MVNRVHEMSNGMFLKTKNAVKSWDDSTGIKEEILHVTRRGQYWIERYSFAAKQYFAEYMDTRAAARWLRANGYELEAGMEGLIYE